MKHPPCRWLLEYTVLYPRAKTFPTTLDNMSLQAEEPVPKKPKIEEDSEEEEDTAKPASLERNDQGEAFAALSPKKRLTIRQFKGQTLIDIREYYDKDGKMLPGKKGISLTLEQYQAMRDLITSGTVDKAIEEK